MNDWAFGKYIQELLNQKGWNAAKLAEKSGLAASYISSLLRGESYSTAKHPKISVETLIDLARAFEVPESRLILAYKDIRPDEFPVKNNGQINVIEQILVLAESKGIDYKKVPLDQRKSIGDFVITATDQFIKLIVDRELERIQVKKK